MFRTILVGEYIGSCEHEPPRKFYKESSIGLSISCTLLELIRAEAPAPAATEETVIIGY